MCVIAADCLRPQIARHMQNGSVQHNSIHYNPEERPSFLFDETWLNSHAAPEKIMIDEKVEMGVWTRPSGNVKRLIVFHSCSCDGWRHRVDFVFSSKTKSEHYNDEMNNTS